MCERENGGPGGPGLGVRVCMCVCEYVSVPPRCPPPSLHPRLARSCDRWFSQRHWAIGNKRAACWGRMFVSLFVWGRLIAECRQINPETSAPTQRHELGWMRQNRGEHCASSSLGTDSTVMKSISFSFIYLVCLLCLWLLICLSEKKKN